jgi:ATP-dependent protease ClpP protease subunit
VTGHIFIYGEVGKQVTLDTVLKEITPKTSDYIVHIHSNGGDVFEGYAIYNALKNTGKEITVQIEGVCASIATLIASAGTKIVMNTKSQFMIHNPRISSMSGESKDLRNVAGQLDKIKNQLISSWVGRTKLSQEQLSQMYDNETWLSPEQALEYGFVDEVSEVLKAVASADIKKFKFMQDKKSLIGRIEHLINNFFSPKNVTATLADGTVVQLPEGDPVGGQISYEDGSPVPPGEYPLSPESGGAVIVVGDNSTIAEVREMPMEDKQDEPENDMKLKEENESLKARVAELESALQARNEAAEKAEAKAKTFENKLNVELKAVQDELSKIKNTTAGDDTPPAKGTKPVITAGAPVYDPMGEEVFKILKSSNRI